MRVLFVAYLFPPVGGAGVQRVTKLVRYLPDHGITPLVLTASNPSVPVLDATLVEDISKDIRIERTMTLEPSYDFKRAFGQGSDSSERSGSFGRFVRYASRLAKGMAFPDPQVFWLPSAALAISRLAAEKPELDAAVISAPPFSQLLLLPWIKKTMRVPVIVDYRDEWDTTMRAGHDEPASALANRAARRLEQAIVTRADAITTATQEFRTALLDRIDALDPGRVHFLPNGWDAGDLPKGQHRPPKDRFRISYVGTVLRLTSLRNVIEALRILHGERPDLAACVELVVHGRIAPSEKPTFEGAERLGVRLRGYLEHRRALVELAQSHLNLCVLENVEGAERIYPAKIFELMALRRRTLVITPPGALERLARYHQVGDVVSPPNPSMIARLLVRHVEAWQAGSYEWRVEPIEVQRFERRALAGELAGILRGFCKQAGTSEVIQAASPAVTQPRLAG